MGVVRLLFPAFLLAVLPSGVAAQQSFRPAPLQRGVAALRLQSLLVSRAREGPARPAPEPATAVSASIPFHPAPRFPAPDLRVALAGPFELRATLSWQQARPRGLLAVAWRL